MIFPNLMVKDVVTSAKFYRDVIGMSVIFYAAADQAVYEDGDEEGHDIVFAMLTLDGAQLGLQEIKSLQGEMPAAVPTQTPMMTGTVYFRDADVSHILKHADQDTIIKQPETSWYGMRELYLSDPDGYVICCGEQDQNFNPEAIS